MLRQIRANGPQLIKLAHEFKYLHVSVETAATELTKQAFVIDKVSSSARLVSETMKLGSMVIKALAAGNKSSALEDFSTKGFKAKGKKQLKKGLEKTNSLASMTLPKALGIGAGLAIPGAVATNYLMDKASDDVDQKMYAIPGLVGATVAAILAAKAGTGDTANVGGEEAVELAKALEAKEVLDNVETASMSPDTAVDVAKVAQLNTEHIALLVSEILTA